MSKVVHHRDGSYTVTFSNGNKATFGKTKKTSAGHITGTPYVFASGPKIELPSGVAHGMIFEHRRKLYVALHYRGTDSLGRRAGACYGQPITLTRPS